MTSLAVSVDYSKFLNTKVPKPEKSGLRMSVDEMPSYLFDYQKHVVRRALDVGRFAIFADTGMGKTAMQLAWAHCISEHTNGGKVLILTPLAVAEQTRNEAKKFGQCIDNFTVVNYEQLHNLNPEDYVAVVLDESSILKGMMGKVRTQINDFCSDHNYLLSCTATPSPNDFMEIGTQSEFLRHMGQQQMLAMFFTHDSARTSKWRLKHHGKERFYDWMTTWCCALRMPSDLGFSDKTHELPPLKVSNLKVGELDESIDQDSMGMLQRNTVRKESVEERCKKAADVANKLIAKGENVLVWCNLNSESDLLQSLIKRSRAIKGSDKAIEKEHYLNRFAKGNLPCLITKPSIAGFGMNFQHHCCNAIFVGLSDSWEQYYQGLRRVWRFGQKNPVNINIVSHANEGAVLQNIKRKTEDNDTLMSELCSRTIRIIDNHE